MTCGWGYITCRDNKKFKGRLIWEIEKDKNKIVLIDGSGDKEKEEALKLKIYKRHIALR